MNNIEKYLESLILKHKDYDETGSIYNHVKDVVRRSKLYADEYNKTAQEKLNLDLVLAIAALHDIGFKYGRKDHNINSRKMVESDRFLKKYFSDSDFEILLDAIEDHKSSAGRTPRSVYGYLIKEADRDDPKTLDEILGNSVNINLFENPDKSNEELAELIWNVHDGRYKTLHFKVPSSVKNHRNLNNFFSNKKRVIKRLLELLQEKRNSDEFKIIEYKSLMR